MFGIDTIFYVFLALAAVSAATAAVGVKQSGDAQKAAADYSAEVNKQNAKTAAEQGLFDAEQTRNKNKRILAAQRAVQSGSGFDPDAGTALDVRADSAAQGEMDALIAIYTGGSSSTANQSRAQLNRMEGRQAQRAGNISAGASLLGGAADIGTNPHFYN